MTETDHRTWSREFAASEESAVRVGRLREILRERRPEPLQGALRYLHGGGYVVGSPETTR